MDYSIFNAVIRRSLFNRVTNKRTYVVELLKKGLVFSSYQYGKYKTAEDADEEVKQLAQEHGYEVLPPSGGYDYSNEPGYKRIKKLRGSSMNKQASYENETMEQKDIGGNYSLHLDEVFFTENAYKRVGFEVVLVAYDEVEPAYHSVATVKTTNRFKAKELYDSINTMEDFTEAQEMNKAASKALKLASELLDGILKEAAKKLTKQMVAEILDASRIAYNQKDLREIVVYLNGPQRAMDYDNLSSWVQMCLKEIEKQNTTASVKQAAGYYNGEGDFIQEPDVKPYSNSKKLKPYKMPNMDVFKDEEPAKAEPTEQELQEIWHIISDAWGESFPDGDPIDIWYNKLRKKYQHLMRDYGPMDLANLAAKKINESESYNDWLADSYDAVINDQDDASLEQLGLTRGDNPWRSAAVDKSIPSRRYPKWYLIKVGCNWGSRLIKALEELGYQVEEHGDADGSTSYIVEICVTDKKFNVDTLRDQLWENLSHSISIEVEEAFYDDEGNLKNTMMSYK